MAPLRISPRTAIVGGKHGNALVAGSIPYQNSPPANGAVLMLQQRLSQRMQRRSGSKNNSSNNDDSSSSNQEATTVTSNNINTTVSTNLVMIGGDSIHLYSRIENWKGSQGHRTIYDRRTGLVQIASTIALENRSSARSARLPARIKVLGSESWVINTRREQVAIPVPWITGKRHY